jgi:uncharacterized protein (AIM24 family)
MTLDVQLVGTTTKMAIVSLRPGQVVYSEAGKFLFSSGDVVMETKLFAPSAPGGQQPQQNGGGGFGGLGGGGGSGALGGLLRGAMDARHPPRPRPKIPINHK